MTDCNEFQFVVIGISKPFDLFHVYVVKAESVENSIAKIKAQHFNHPQDWTFVCHPIRTDVDSDLVGIFRRYST